MDVNSLKHDMCFSAETSKDKTTNMLVSKIKQKAFIRTANVSMLQNRNKHLLTNKPVKNVFALALNDKLYTCNLFVLI